MIVVTTRWASPARWPTWSRSIMEWWSVGPPTRGALGNPRHHRTEACQGSSARLTWPAVCSDRSRGYCSSSWVSGWPDRAEASWPTGGPTWSRWSHPAAYRRASSAAGLGGLLPVNPVFELDNRTASARISPLAPGRRAACRAPGPPSRCPGPTFLTNLRPAALAPLGLGPDQQPAARHPGPRTPLSPGYGLGSSAAVRL